MYVQSPYTLRNNTSIRIDKTIYKIKTVSFVPYLKTIVGVFVYVCICMCVCVCVFVYVCVCVYVYVCVFMFILLITSEDKMIN